jgi:hypothetical protein
MLTGVLFIDEVNLLDMHGSYIRALILTPAFPLHACLQAYCSLTR